MIFNSLSFLLFMPIVFGVYWLVPKKASWQNGVLMIASIFFYGWWDWRFLALIGVSVLWTYAFALKLEKGNRAWLIVGVAGLVAALGFFKYYNFFVESITSSSTYSLHLILPLGISFYTFMAIGYLCDVYWRKLHAERNPQTCAVFLIFFPQIAAGPIGRAPEMLPQYNSPRRFDNAMAVDGCRQFLWGLAKKVVVADGCATLVDRLFIAYQDFSGSMLALGAFMYAVQIYCDFSGYSDMAIGLGKLHGIRLRKNFAYPYFASNIGDFWRRWHMSLTTWFRDYVYIPLGGSRCWLGRIILNTWIVFLLSGLWHGAAWTFVVWGAVHAALLTVLLVWKRIGIKIPAFVGWMLTVVGVMLAWIFFRAPSFDVALGYLNQLFSRSLFTIPTKYLSMMPWIAGLLAVEWIQRNKEHALARLTRYRPVNWLIYLSLSVICLAYQQRTGNFIYFNF